MTAADAHPFVRHRERLDSYHRALQQGWSDDRFVELVGWLDQRVAEVGGTGFVTTPVLDGGDLARAAGIQAGVELFVKVEIDSVGGSHRARPLFGVALHSLIDASSSDLPPAPLAIASCGNAAIAAATIAAAMQRPIDVFVPTWADAPTVALLDELGARITTCEPQPGDIGDPCYARFRAAVDGGAQPFGVQGTDTVTTFDGGRTLGWELADQVADLDAIYIQVGGGALATATAQAMPDVALFPVQAEGCAPLRRAWDALAPDFDLDAAAADPDHYMWPWDNPSSAATGILDDITYDWLPLLRATLSSGGEPIVAPEAKVVEAHRLAAEVTGLAVSATGTAGFAGLITHSSMSDRVSPGNRVAVLFTGVERTEEVPT